MKHTKAGLFLLFWLLVVAIIFFYPALLKLIFPFPYRDIVEKNSSKYDLDPLLVISVIKVESRFNPMARSADGARGLMQVMPETGAWVATQQKQFFKPGYLDIPECNINFGCWYLRYLRKKFAGNTPLMLCAYNSGHNNVQDWVKDKIWSGSLKEVDKIPYPETRDFLDKVLNNYTWYKKIYGGNSP